MAKKAKKSKATGKAKSSKSPSKCKVCGGDCHDPHARLPGYLLIAAGLLAVPLNFGLIGGLEFAKAWPLLLVLFGFAVLVKVELCRSRS